MDWRFDLACISPALGSGSGSGFVDCLGVRQDVLTDGGESRQKIPSRTLMEQSACWLPSRLRQDPRRYQPQQGLAFPVGSRDDGWKIVTTSRLQPRRERSCVGWRAPVNGPSGVDARSRWIPSPNRVHRLPQVSQPHVRERPLAVPHMFQSCCVRCCKPWN